MVRGVSPGDTRRGEVVGLLGPNGAGKTTSFYMIVGLVRPDAGRVIVDDAATSRRMPMYLRARKHGHQLSAAGAQSVFRKLTVEENILAVLETLQLSWEFREGRARSG